MQIDDFSKLNSNNQVHISGRNLSAAGNPASVEKQSKEPAVTGDSNVFYAADFNSGANTAGYDKNSIKDESLAEEIERKSSSFTDAETTKRNLSMAVAGFSVEDINGAREEGYDTEEMEPDQIITVIDQIKMHLALGGQDISAMGGLSSEEIEGMAGSNSALSAAVEQALVSADLPVDDNIISDGVTALKKASELTQLEPQTIEYLLKNELEPTIENVYVGSFSQGSYAQQTNTITEEDMDSLMPQIDNLIKEANLPLDDNRREAAKWMLEREIPVTPENLKYLNELKTNEPELSVEKVVERMTDSVSEGKRPQEAYVLPGYSMKDMAESAYETVNSATREQVYEVVDEDLPLTVESLRNKAETEARTQIIIPGDAQPKTAENISAPISYEIPEDTSKEQAHAMRVLEETRLIMTKEANLSLLKQGFSIDTSELTEVVDKLRDFENSFYIANLSPKDEVVDESELTVKIDIFNETNTKTSELSEMPAVLLGKVPVIRDATLNDLHRQGVGLKKLFEDAGERYETMRTEVRRDLGDSIQKAFRNVDDILEDLGMEATEQNRRAVRILSYNEQAITTDSVKLMKAGDELVTRTIKSLTPGVVAKMIQNGENPLNLSMQELKDKAQEIKAASASDSPEEKFSRFLFKAQQQGEFSQEERDAFVGVYRLIYQVEKTDGAVIGQLIAQGADITLKNLMGAVRTRKHENREYAVDDNFGFAEFDRSSLSITEQIEMAFETNRMRDAGELATPQKLAAIGEDSYLEMTPDRFADALENMSEDIREMQLDRDYDKLKRTELENAVKTESRIYELLSEYDIPQSPANLEAFSRMLSDRNGMFRRLFAPDRRRDENRTAPENELINSIADEFLDALSDPEELQNASQRLRNTAENMMENMLTDEPSSTLDIRALRMSVKQISLAGDMGRRSETYSIPVVIDDQVGNMTLKVIRGSSAEQGQVDMSVETESLGAIRATFKVEADQIAGRITASTAEADRRLSRAAQDISASLQETAELPVSIDISRNHRLDANSIFRNDRLQAAPGEDGQRPQVQTRLLYGIAKSFIGELGSI